MEKVVVQVKNNRAFRLLEDMEGRNIIKVLRRTPYYPSGNKDRVTRLSEIRSITDKINIDLSNFHFNRDEANDYDS